MDNEISGAGNSYTAEYWQYDPRLGRRWNIDPIKSHWESSYAVFSNNPIIFMDPEGLSSTNGGDEKFEKPGGWKRFWRALSGDYYITRAEVFAAESQERSDILDVQMIRTDDNTVVVAATHREHYEGQFLGLDEEGNATYELVEEEITQFSVFRKSGRGWFFNSPDNDTYNMSMSEFINGFEPSQKVMDVDFPGYGTAVSTGVKLAGYSSRLFLISQTTKALANWKKYLRIGVNHDDVLNKGFHLHFDDLEMGMRTMNDGKIGLTVVGKKGYSLLRQTKAVEVFSQAMNNVGFRSQLLTHLVNSQYYLKTAYKGGKYAQLAIDRAHELNYLIDAVRNYGK